MSSKKTVNCKGDVSNVVLNAFEMAFYTFKG